MVQVLTCVSVVDSAKVNSPQIQNFKLKCFTLTFSHHTATENQRYCDRILSDTGTYSDSNKLHV